MYSYIKLSPNMGLILSIGGIETHSRSLTLNSLYTSLKYQLRLMREIFLINLTYYMIYISRNSVELFVVKLISLLELCGRQIFR